MVALQARGLAEVRVPLLKALCWAVLAEFLLARLLSRVGVFIPKSGAALAIYQGAIFLGEVAFNLSLGLAALALGLALWPQGRWLALLAGAAAWLSLTGNGLLTVTLLLAAVVALAGRALRRVEAPLRAGLALVLLAQVGRYLAAGLQLLWGELALPGELPGASWLLRGGELLAVLAPLALAAPALGAIRGRALRGGMLVRRAAPAAVAAALLLAGLWIDPDMTGILTMYALGFTLSWPALLYVPCAAAAVLALQGLAGEERWALALLFLAGLGLNVNQQQMLVLAGWALLALPTVLREEVGSGDPV